MSARYSKPVYLYDFPWWVFDFLIVAGCVVAALVAYLWSWWALVPLGVLLYGSFIEPRLLTVRRVRVGTGERTLKVAFVSDIHVGPYKGEAWVRKLVDVTHALQPDLILLGGDFIYEKSKDLPKLDPLKTFQAPLGVYAILGNHDEYKASKEAHAWFEHSGVPLLENRSVRAQPGMTIAGTDDDWYGHADLEASFKDIPSEDLAIVMLHNPDLAPHAAEMLRHRPGKTVFFCGHTHGGQIRLPFIGSVMPLPHHLGRRYDRGVFNFKGIPLVLGAGTGESGPRARLFCPPEIVLVEVRY